MYEYASAADSSGGSPARRGHKKETTCGFLLLVNLPLSLRGHGEKRRDETAPKRGTAEDFFFRRGAQSAPITQPIRNARYPTATHIGYSPQARHKVNCPKGERNHRVHFPFSILNFPFYTHKKEESSRFPLARYSLLYPLGVTIASSGVTAAQSGQALPRTKFR